MRFDVFAVVLVAAALHAAWNAVVKSGNDKLLTTILVTSSAAAIALVCLPFLDSPARASWPFLALSVALEIVYFALVAQTYRLTDMSLAYPLMRGAAPLLVVLAGSVFIGETLPVAGLAGVVVISLGILGVGFEATRAGVNKGSVLALVNAMVIASYTLVDGMGVRRSGSPASYTLWIFLLTGCALMLWALGTRQQAFLAYARKNWHYGAMGGVGTLLSYGMALWAMTLAPVALVAALRETSILFGTAVSAIFLRETVGRVRIAAVCVIAVGAVVLRLA